MKTAYIYVSYNFGLGHLQRSYLIARALVRAGHRVKVFCSGEQVDIVEPDPRIYFRWLEADVIQDTRRPVLRPVNPDLTPEAMHAGRVEEVLRAFDEEAPDLLLTEFFPFTPERLEATMVPILEACRDGYPDCLIASSVREFPLNDYEPVATHPTPRILELIHRYYDVVVVHARRELSLFQDPDYMSRYPSADAFEFTDYVVDHHRLVEAPAKEFDVLVTVGGGRDGAPVIRSALGALRAMNRDLKIKVIGGPFLDREQVSDLGVVESEPVVRGMIEQIQRARCVVSMAGYNSTSEILAAGTPALLIPRRGSLEQEERARLACRYQEWIRSASVGDSHAVLASKIRELLRLKPAPIRRFFGADQTVRALEQRAHGRCIRVNGSPEESSLS